MLQRCKALLVRIKILIVWFDVALSCSPIVPAGMLRFISVAGFLQVKDAMDPSDSWVLDSFTIRLLSTPNPIA